jgi:aldehyde:ferredoxin oxidoreductase
MFGYMGKILRVNLSDSTISTEEIDLQMAQAYIGGAGFISKILYDEVPAKTDPLGPDNRLVFMTGPLTGTRYPTSGRYVVGSKSPLTGIMTTSTSSGFFGNELKRTGHDGIVIEGASEKPVYLEIIDDQVSLKDASDLWGKDSYETQEILKGRIHKRARIACIGQSGEHLAPLACVMNCDGRAAGRGGTGAVMGSKNLKAIAARGTQKVEVAAPDYLNQMASGVVKGIETMTHGQFAKWGTAGSMDSMADSGDIPVKNWQVGEWKEGCLKLGGQRIRDTILKHHPSACFNCPIRCARWVKIEKGRFKYEGASPEYETLAAFGTMLLIDDLEAVAWIGQECNKYGVDTISTGATVAWAMEAFEKGALTTADTGGIDLTWGNVDAVVEVVKQIGRNEGLGKLMAMGSRKAAQTIGNDSETYAVHVKGMELPMHDPRAFFSMAVNYATGTRGACHLQGMPYLNELALLVPEAGLNYKQGRWDKKGKGLACMVYQDLNAVINCLGVCVFSALGLQPSQIGGLLGMVSGLPYDSKAIQQAGARIINLQRAFACREGISRKDDKLPKRVLTPVPDGGSAGKAPDLEFQLNEYYELRQWDDNGIPTAGILNTLGLDSVANDLSATA